MRNFEPMFEEARASSPVQYAKTLMRACPPLSRAFARRGGYSYFASDLGEKPSRAAAELESPARQPEKEIIKIRVPSGRHSNDYARDLISGDFNSN